MKLHAENRQRLVQMMKASGQHQGAILLQGGDQETRYDTDCEVLFRQESFFNFLFGVSEAGFYGSIDIDTGKATLFMPRLHELYAVWQGEIKPPSHFLTT